LPPSRNQGSSRFAATGGILLLALLHTGLTLLGRLLLFLLALALHSGTLLQCLAALFLIGLSRIRLPRLGMGALQDSQRFLRVRCPGHDDRRHLGTTRVLPLFNALQPLCGTLPALPVIHHGFLLAQHRQMLTRATACRPQAIFDGKALVAGSLGSLQGFVNGQALSTDAFAFSSVIQSTR